MAGCVTLCTDGLAGAAAGVAVGGGARNLGVIQAASAAHAEPKLMTHAVTAEKQ